MNRLLKYLFCIGLLCVTVFTVYAQNSLPNNDACVKKEKEKKRKKHHESSVPVNTSVPKELPREVVPTGIIAPVIKEVYLNGDTSRTSWADSVFNTLTPDERIAQLFMVPAYSNKGKEHREQIAELISENKIGGLIFFQGGPVRQAKLTNYYQSISRVPLMVTIDGEWGLAMRLDSTFKFPRQQTLGAISNDTLIYKMGKQIAKHCSRIGLHVNFAPVIDVNNNPANPVISNRSFGENKYKVTQKGYMYMRGMQDARIMATGKHFPGHGDTDSDSHATLPIINHNKERIDSLELYPFKRLFNEGLLSTMVAHLYIPAWDSAANQASSLSPAVINKLLKEDLNYKGLVFTDALNMKGVTKFYNPGFVDVKAILAGNDILECTEDVPKAMEQVKEAIYQGLITQEEIDLRCLKILRFKEWSGLNHYKPVDIARLYEELNDKESEIINREIIEESITLLVNRKEALPLVNTGNKKIACIAINEKEQNRYQCLVSNYANVKQFNVSSDTRIKELDTLLAELKEYDFIIAGVFNIQSKPEKNFGMPAFTSWFIDSLARLKPTFLTMFGNAYSITKLGLADSLAGLLLAYEDNINTQEVAAQILFGAKGAKGHLPVTVPPLFKSGSGIVTQPLADRLSYVLPLQVGADEKYLAKIDSVVLNAIKAKAMPGCQVFAAKEGKVFFNKCYGSPTYEGKQKVGINSIYDLASVTKIAASSLAIMKLYDLGKLDLNATLGSYLPELKGTDKENIVIKEMLAHQAGLPAWIPFWMRTVVKDSMRSDIYSPVPTDTFSLRVADGIYENKFYVDSIYQQINEAPLGEKKYLYSDLGYYLMKKIIEKQSGTTLDTFLLTQFYQPMGLSLVGYKPLIRYAKEELMPTENDKLFRKQQLQGDVHDQGAAMLGGVAGHAGLFSNATQLGTLMQMLINGGTYAGNKYLSDTTIKRFTSCAFCAVNGNRRGLCFDKPEPDTAKDSPCSKYVTQSSFGHSGFTGTYTWADPESGIVYVFLSNRVYQDAENKKLAQMGVRTKVQDLLYQALGKN